jgi:hypothetical protein
VLGVFPAEGAILVQLKTIGSVLLVLGRIVVPLLAFAASKGYFYPHFGTSCFVASLCEFDGKGLFQRTKTDLPIDRCS